MFSASGCIFGSMGLKNPIGDDFQQWFLIAFCPDSVLTLASTNGRNVLSL